MELRTWERRRRDDMGLLRCRRCVELRAGSRRLALRLPELPALDARERERLLGRRMTAGEVAEARRERRRRLRAWLRRRVGWLPWDGC